MGMVWGTVFKTHSLFLFILIIFLVVHTSETTHTNFLEVYLLSAIRRLSNLSTSSGRVKLGIFGQTAKFGQPLFHILNIGIKIILE